MFEDEFLIYNMDAGRFHINVGYCLGRVDGGPCEHFVTLHGQNTRMSGECIVDILAANGIDIPPHFQQPDELNNTPAARRQSRRTSQR